VEVVVIAGRLNVSGPISGTNGITIHNFDALRFTGTNSYSGDTRLVDGTLLVDGSQPFSRILPAGGIAMVLSYAGGDGNDVTLSPLPAATGVTKTWDGGGANNQWTNAINWVGNVAPVPGDDLVFPAGAAQLGNVNNFPSNTLFNSIRVTGGGYTISDLSTSKILLNDGLHFAAGATVNWRATVGLTRDQTFTNQSGALVDMRALSEFIDNGGFTLTLRHETLFSWLLPAIHGSGGLTKTGAGNANLGSSSVSNSYAGVTTLLEGGLNADSSYAFGDPASPTIVMEGTTLTVQNTAVAESIVLRGRLASGIGNNSVGRINVPGGAVIPTIFLSAAAQELRVAGELSGSGPVEVLGPGTLVVTAPSNSYSGEIRHTGTGAINVRGRQPAGAVRIEGTGTLSGTGTVGQVTAILGGVNPGMSEPGILHSSNVFFGTNGGLTVLLSGPVAGAGYDQLQVNGSVSMTNSTLVVFLTFQPAEGQAFVIIDNDAADAIQGNFRDLMNRPLPEGALITNGPSILRITYAGGDGNDVTLAVPGGAPPSTVSPLVLSNGVATISGTGFSNTTYVLEATADLNAPIPWQPIGTNTSSGSGVYQFIDLDATNFPMRFYRVLSP